MSMVRITLLRGPVKMSFIESIFIASIFIHPRGRGNRSPSRVTSIRPPRPILSSTLFVAIFPVCAAAVYGTIELQVHAPTTFTIVRPECPQTHRARLPLPSHPPIAAIASVRLFLSALVASTVEFLSVSTVGLCLSSTSQD